MYIAYPAINHGGFMLDVFPQRLPPAPSSVFRGPTPVRPRHNAWIKKQRGHMAKAFRAYAIRYAIRYADKAAILRERNRLEREANIAQRSGQSELAKRLMERSVTWPR
jgi:hypothetical protein